METGSASTFPRFLGTEDLRRTPVLRTDVLIIGGGIAGAAAAIAAADQGAAVLLVSKSELTETNTAYAQGGVAAVLATDDSTELHLEDTLRVGAGLTDETIARHIIQEGPAAIDWFRSHNAKFDTDEAGNLLLSREGGHSAKRVVHSNGDATGKELQSTFTRLLHEHPNIDVQTGSFVRDLLIDQGRCVGATVLNNQSPMAVEAGTTILATGGAGQVYRETTNPIGACGDGVALAFRAGARIRDMEFVQFHPTTLYIAGASRFLISEVLRGAGGILKDRNGIRFMPDEHPSAELAPRDVVSRAILDRMVATGDTHVYLDLSQVDGDPHQLFPSISRICRSFDIDVAKDPVPVRPGAHYILGGVETDMSGCTSLPGLLAVGESAGTGFHGANRLASNSLLEGIVLGQRAGLQAAGDCHPQPIPKSMPCLGVDDNPPRLHLEDMLYSLKSLMWRQVGLKRSAQGLAEATTRIALWNHYLMRTGLGTIRAFELTNMLTVSALITKAAEARHESRGTHYRSDYPIRNDQDWCRTLTLELCDENRVLIQHQALKSPTDQAAPHAQ